MRRFSRSELVRSSFRHVHLGSVAAAASGQPKDEVVRRLKAEHCYGRHAGDGMPWTRCDTKGVHHGTWDEPIALITWGEIAGLMIEHVGDDPDLSTRCEAWSNAWRWLNNYEARDRRGKPGPPWERHVVASDPEWREWWWPTYRGLTAHIRGLLAEVIDCCCADGPEQLDLLAHLEASAA